MKVIFIFVPPPCFICVNRSLSVSGIIPGKSLAWGYAALFDGSTGEWGEQMWGGRFTCDQSVSISQALL